MKQKSEILLSIRWCKFFFAESDRRINEILFKYSVKEVLDGFWIDFEWLKESYTDHIDPRIAKETEICGEDHVFVPFGIEMESFKDSLFVIFEHIIQTEITLK